MTYSSGMLDHRVTIRNKQTDTAFGGTTAYEDAATVWAGVTWSRGTRSLREGSLDAYDTVLIRMRWNNVVRRDSRLVCDGVTYQVQSLHRDYKENIVQITATEVVK